MTAGSELQSSSLSNFSSLPPHPLFHLLQFNATCWGPNGDQFHNM